MTSQNGIVPTALISQKIFFIRGTRIMLDAALARLYAVATKKHEQSRQAKRKPVSFRFHVPTFTQGTAQFGVPVWNLNARARRPSLRSLCFHGARRSDAFPACSAVRAPFRRTSRSCEPLCGFAKCSQRTKSCAGKLTPWISATMRDFRPFLRRFAGCSKHQFQRKNRSDFTPDLRCQQNLPSPPKQV
jgi:hypothetical protein